jgi:excisionase family DNA binding protein
MNRCPSPVLGPGTEEYLTIAEVASLVNCSPKTIQNKMASGALRRGVHYFRPSGMGPRFKRSAVVAWIEEREEQQASPAKGIIPMARGYALG